MDVKKENGAVDIAKLIMAILVIIIHKPLFKSDFLGYMSGCVVCSIAVPFFFVASSYFFFLKIKNTDITNKKLFDFEKRLFKLYLIWTIIYIPCIFVKYNTDQYEMLNLKFLCGQVLLTVKNFFLSTSFVHFWYVNTLMLSVAVVFLLNKKFNYKTAAAICIMITVVSRIVSALDPETLPICRIYGMIPVVIRNSFEKGLFCTAGGLILSRVNVEKCGIVRSAALSIAALTALIINGYFTYKSGSVPVKFPLFFLAAVSSVLLMSLCLNINMKPSEKYVIVRKYSTLMYFSHLLLMSEGFRFIASKTGMEEFTESNLLIFITTVLFSVSVSTIIIALSQKEKFKFLKNLY